MDQLRQGSPCPGLPRGLVASRYQPSGARQLTADVVAQGCESRGELSRLSQDLALDVTSFPFPPASTCPVRHPDDSDAGGPRAHFGKQGPGKTNVWFAVCQGQGGTEHQLLGQTASAHSQGGPPWWSPLVVPLGHTGQWIIGNVLSWIMGD